MRALDRKLAAIHSGTYTPDDFIIADAKDADMAFGVQAPGPAGGGYRTREDYLADMDALVRADLLDVLLTSASNGERMARSGVLDDSSTTLAVRANDTTDIWFPRGAGYSAHPSRPFRTAHLASVREFCDLVLYSVTFNNDVDRDLASLAAFAQFREAAHQLQMRYFLEVFNPNAAVGLAPDEVGAFVNDSIVRALAGVTSAHRPLFLKIAYNGHAGLGELAAHDPTLVVGILGGSAGTTRDAFELLTQGRAGRRPSGPVRPQDPAGGVPARPRGAHEAGAARRGHPRAGGSRLPRDVAAEGDRSPATTGRRPRRHRAAAEGVAVPPRSGVLCGGSIVADVSKTIDWYPTLERLAVIDDVSLSTGGPGLNMAVDLRRLGAGFPVDVVGVVGDDEHGRFVLAACADLGIASTGVAVRPGAVTSFTDAMVVRDGGRRTFFHHVGANALLDVSDFDLDASGARILHLGAPGLHPRLDAAQPGGNGWAALLRRAHEVGMRTNLELVSLDAARVREAALPCLPHLDSLVINEVEAAALTGIDVSGDLTADDRAGTPGPESAVGWERLEAAAVRLLELGVGRLAVVHFPAGCVAATRDGQVLRHGSVRLDRSAIRSATGAGDAFAAGVILGLHDDLPVEQCLRLGVCSAAASLQGANTSDGILPAAQCLAAGERAGFRPTG